MTTDFIAKARNNRKIALATLAARKQAKHSDNIVAFARTTNVTAPITPVFTSVRTQSAPEQLAA